MVWNVFRDYIDSFRWGRIKEVFGNFSTGWIVFYVLVMYPVLIADIWEGNRISYYGSVIPMLLTGFSMGVTEIRLPKQMMLCPLDIGERKRYLYTMFVMRILAPALPGLFLYGACCFWIKAPAIFYVSGIFSMFSFSLCAAFCALVFGSPRGSAHKNGERRKPKRQPDIRLKGLGPIALTGTGISILLLAGSIGLAKQIMQMPRWVGAIWAAAAAIELQLDVLAAGYIRPAIEIAADYEKTCLN